MTSTQPPSAYVARGPVDLIAIVPVVLGFHPEDSVVLLTFAPRGGGFHARVDLPADRSEQEEVTEVLLDAVRSNRVEQAAVLIYTDDAEAARSQGSLLLEGLLALGVGVIEVMRVDDGRWSLPLEDELSGAPTGAAYDLETHPFTAQRVFEGKVVHRDRAELVDSLVGTDEDDAVEVALAATRFAELVASSTEVRSDAAGFLRVEARWLQRRVRRWRTERRELGPVDAARLLVLVSLTPVRDVAWAEIDRPNAGDHLELWRHLVRRSPRHLLPAACSLTAFAAWQHGDGALAWCAIDRCLEVDPDYSMAHCLAQMLTAAVPPDVWEPIPEDALPVLDPGPAPGGSADRAS